MIHEAVSDIFGNGLLLDIETRIGELLPDPHEAQATMKGQSAFTSKKRRGRPEGIGVKI